MEFLWTRETGHISVIKALVIDIGWKVTLMSTPFLSRQHCIQEASQLRGIVAVRDNRFVRSLHYVNINSTAADSTQAIVLPKALRLPDTLGCADQRDAGWCMENRRWPIAVGNVQLTIEGRDGLPEIWRCFGCYNFCRYENGYRVTNSGIPVSLTHQLGTQL